MCFCTAQHIYTWKLCVSLHCSIYILKQSVCLQQSINVLLLVVWIQNSIHILQFSDSVQYRWYAVYILYYCAFLNSTVFMYFKVECFRAKIVANWFAMQIIIWLCYIPYQQCCLLVLLGFWHKSSVGCGLALVPTQIKFQLRENIMTLKKMCNEKFNPRKPGGWIQPPLPLFYD